MAEWKKHEYFPIEQIGLQNGPYIVDQTIRYAEKNEEYYTPISIEDTGYFYGTKYTILFEDKRNVDGFVHATMRGINGDVDVRKKSTEIWSVAEAYYNSGVFHEPTTADRPPCCDIGKATVYYRKRAADPQSVPRLMAIVQEWFGLRL